VPPAEELDELELRAVGVLVLVDENEIEASLDTSSTSAFSRRTCTGRTSKSSNVTAFARRSAPSSSA
jgi:hypothetical protein